jgi:hypothetical protein
MFRDVLCQEYGLKPGPVAISVITAAREVDIGKMVVPGLPEHVPLVPALWEAIRITV